MPRLKRLIFNFISMDPARVGGAARLAQCLAEHVPEGADPSLRTLVATAHDTWEQHFPLKGDFETLDASGCSKWGAGWAIEQAFEVPSARRTFLVQAARPFQKAFRFPASWREGTIVHVPTQVIHPRPPKHWNLPYVMNLADIQHEHFPEFFSPQELAKRRRRFLESAHAAAAVCVADEWTRRDILAHLPISPDKVHAIPLAPTWDLGQAPSPVMASECARGLGLPERFAFYPAQTWAHKNHARLFEALAHLKSKGVILPLACCGHQNEHHAELLKRAAELGLGDQIHWLGLRTEAEVRALYVASTLVVVPTLFEGGPGIPVLEAMAFQKPLAAASICGIPEAVGDTGLLFDPLDPADMATALQKLWQDGAFAAELAARAYLRISQRTWAKTSEAYRALYEDVLDRVSGHR
ncbi:hypothetical protein GETHLI_10110 [Geothrix limicola]|uniref:Glycosyl transferase family 1 domain-containing protein n=1 Tax=Geothrix limicola TaxID=2927978 RepID=A0ABQ5QEP0_9BACT|nr:glycosyltransferase family 1 protein [Geothrix limicola]GLH72509.1 hypothetical protein GETHLI_10110 [Geothrix limicola]